MYICNDIIGNFLKMEKTLEFAHFLALQLYIIFWGVHLDRILSYQEWSWKEL